MTVSDASRAGRLTVLLLIDDQPFGPLAKYFRERNFSLASEDGYARAVGLFVDFMLANSDHFAEPARRGELFNSFAHAVMYGTLEGGNDRTGLWWLPRPNFKHLVLPVIAFSDWLALRHGTKPLNPWRRASISEQIVFWRRWNLVSANSLLKHLKQSADAIPASNAARKHRLPDAGIRVQAESPPSFPEEKFERLLVDGFCRPGKRASPFPWLRFNLRDMMTAVLMHGAGLRISEPFHIWLQDVFLDPHDPHIAHVRVFHPSGGEVETTSSHTGAKVTMSRAAYLQLNQMGKPLNQRGRRNGWKNNGVMRDGFYMPVFWYPTEWGRLFKVLFLLYLEYSRPSSGLPWLFLTEDGQPMTAKAYAEQHSAAIARIGLVPRKRNGTTPHGHRHAFGQRLQDAADRGLIGSKTIQLCLHHNSVASQKVYTQRQTEIVNDQLLEASRSLSGPPASTALETLLGTFTLQRA